MRSFFSNTVTSCPTRASCCAAARPAGPLPIDRDLLAGARRPRLRRHPALGPALVDDGVLDRLDADRRVVEVERARRFAGRGADAAGELGEVVGRVQDVERGLPVLPVHQVVEVRNDVVDRAAVVAERDAAVHAARALHCRLLVGQVQNEFLPVLLARGRRLGGFLQPLIFKEPGDLAHDVSLVSTDECSVRRAVARPPQEFAKPRLAASRRAA